jgi:hypothetical protein
LRVPWTCSGGLRSDHGSGHRPEHAAVAQLQQMIDRGDSADALKGLEVPVAQNPAPAGDYEKAPQSLQQAVILAAEKLQAANQPKLQSVQ